MKKLVTIISVLCFALCPSFADTWKIEIQLSEIQQLNKTVEVQKAEIKRLETLCQRNGIDFSPKEEIEKPVPSAISQPMFGIFLGETIDSLKKRFKVYPSKLNDFIDEDDPGKIWDIQNKNENVKALSVQTFEDNIYSINVQFVDGSKVNYEAIKSQLGKKYKSEDKGGLSGALFNKGTFYPVIDGITVGIRLNHNIGFMKDDTLDLSYIHMPLLLKNNAEIDRRKVSKVGSDL